MAQMKVELWSSITRKSMLNITYKDRMTNIWVRYRIKVIDIISNMRKKMQWYWAGQINCLEDDGHRVSPLGDNMTRKDEEDQPSTDWNDNITCPFFCEEQIKCILHANKRRLCIRLTRFKWPYYGGSTWNNVWLGTSVSCILAIKRPATIRPFVVGHNQMYKRED